jgi:hypothetical protein
MDFQSLKKIAMSGRREAFVHVCKTSGEKFPAMR